MSPICPSGRAGMKILKAGVVYFTLVFGAGFVLGPIRILEKLRSQSFSSGKRKIRNDLTTVLSYDDPIDIY
jgi:hypothetical protein